MRYAVDVPNVGVFGDPALLVELAVSAEEAGWDGFFIWDHLIYHDPSWPVANPTAVSAAIAVRTEPDPVRHPRHRRGAAPAGPAGGGAGDDRPAVRRSAGVRRGPRLEPGRVDELRRRRRPPGTRRPARRGVGHDRRALVGRDDGRDRPRRADAADPDAAPEATDLVRRALAGQATVPASGPLGRRDAHPCRLRVGRDHAAGDVRRGTGVRPRTPRPGGRASFDVVLEGSTEPGGGAEKVAPYAEAG